MRCRTVLTRVDALRTGELDAPEQSSVDEHLKTCGSCEDSLHDVESLARAVKALALPSPRSFRDIAPHDSLDRVDDVWVAFSRRGLRMISRGSEDEFRVRYAKRYGRALERADLPENLRKQVTAALHGEGVDKPRLDLDFDRDDANDLEAKVLESMSRIPKGEVRSYSWLAEQVGNPKAVRAVANCVARNIVPFVVPCHRVVPVSGGVGKYAFGSKLKREMLEREGVDVERLEELAREGVRLIGSKTTHIVCCPTCKDARRIREENVVPFRDIDDAIEHGFRPCKRCQPFAA
jgi:O-6-methylguanine DNA methyltransferase